MRQASDQYVRLLRGSGAPGEIRTPDLLLRRQPLYPAELRAHGCIQFTCQEERAAILAVNKGARLWLNFPADRRER